MSYYSDQLQHQQCIYYHYKIIFFFRLGHINLEFFFLLVTHTTIGGFYGLVEDILALLPQDEIFILFFEKLDSSVEFSNFVENIGSTEFGKKFEALKVLLINMYFIF